MAFKTVNFEDMVGFENNPDCLIIDVRRPEELAATGKIGGSINIPLDLLNEALANSSDAEFEKKYGKPKPNPNIPLIFSCKMGGRASQASDLAVKLGYKNVSCYKGSWTDWEQKKNLK